MNPANDGSPTEVETQDAEADADTALETSNEADSQDNQPALTGEDRLRAILRGEIPADDAKKDKAGKQADDDDDRAIAENFDSETGEFLEDGPNAETDAEAAPEEAEESDEPDAEEKDDDDDEAGEDEAAPAEDGKPKPGEKKRISIKRGRLSDRDFAIVQLADREHIGLDEAQRRLFGDEPAPKGKTDEEEPAAEESKPGDPTPESIQAEIDGLLEQRKAATKGLDVEKATELSDKIQDLKLQQRELKQVAAQREQSAASQLAGGVQASVQRAVDMYPDAGKEGTALFKAIDAERLAREKTDPGFFRKANWPVLLAVEVATERGVAAVVKTQKPAAGGKPAAKPNTSTAVPPKKAARPAPPNPAPGNTTGTNQNTDAANMAELARAKAARDPEAIKRVIRKMEEAAKAQA